MCSLQLADTKDVDNNTTLLHFLIETMQKKKNGKYANFVIEDFLHVNSAARVVPDALNKNLASLEQSIKKVTPI